MTTSPLRAIVVRFPDWPITAYSLSLPEPLDAETPVAVLHAGTVVACSAAARRHGVAVGQRKREAQAAVPRLEITHADPDRDERHFRGRVRRIEAVTPGVQVLRPGLCAIRSRGPARYYGSEISAAEAILQALLEEQETTAHIGIADGVFTAEQAALASAEARGSRIALVPIGHAARFLAPLPLMRLGDPDLAVLLARLGIHTLGEFAALETDRVRDRFSERGIRLQALAGGADSLPFVPSTPPPELAREVAFDPPLELAEQVAFAIRQTADAVIVGLARAGMVCTEIRIELFDEHGGSADRVWLHPTCFDASAIIDRVRWQLQQVQEASRPTLTDGVAIARIIPVAVDDSAHHQPGLFGQGTDARLHHALSRVQSMLGHEGVRIPVLGGGRTLVDRQQTVPWGDRVVTATPHDRPWPGRLPDPLPTIVYADRPPAFATDGEGQPIRVTDRGELTGDPGWLTAPPDPPKRIVSWAGPWPLHERVWDAQRSIHAHRLQLVLEDDSALVIMTSGDDWSIEGRYD